MPMYEYKCSSCGTVSEVLVGVAQDETEPACTECGSTHLKRMLSIINFASASSSGHSAEHSCGCGHAHGSGGGCACGA